MLLTLTNPRKPRYRVVLFPHAGSGGYAYAQFAQVFSDDGMIQAIQMPGRENRIKDRLIDEPSALVSDIVRVLEEFQCSLPTFFFGHSFGARLAFEVLKQLELMQKNEIVAIFASGSNPPGSENEETIVDLEFDEFCDYLRTYNGTPQELLSNKDAMGLLVPIIKSDMRLLNKLNYEKEQKIIDTPMVALGGEFDHLVSRSNLHIWELSTRGTFKLETFSGDHFYLFDNSKEVVDYIGAEIENYLLHSGFMPASKTMVE